ncbi:MAG TPA: hypothetical protein VFG77_00620 [Nitrososphaeraceae archaeon]|nr:hypothetical protein [Nitrososphaeraceae archaeon]
MFPVRKKEKDSLTRNRQQSVPYGPWFNDLSKLTNEELMRMYNVIATGSYEFAKNAWYFPIGGDQRCPIMIAKGYKLPITSNEMIDFQDIALSLEKQFKEFVDAWDYGKITIRDIESAILELFEVRSIKIIQD